MQLRGDKMNRYLKVLGFQLKLELASNNHQEFLIKTKEYYSQIEQSLKVIKANNPDLIIYPEMSYDDSYEKIFRKLSKDKLIVAGSIYRNRINATIVFQDGIKNEIPKQFASGAEPMVRVIESKKMIDFSEFNIKNHTFYLKNKKLIILNCMEYYHMAYYLARTEPNLFAIISPCSNNNQTVFKEETKALHNHQENVYSFVVNCVSKYNNQKYGQGKSYIYGPVQHHEKEWLNLEKITSDEHACSILNLENNASYFYGEFANNLITYGRSDNYFINPKNIVIKNLIEEKNT